ncbi:MAG: hypothetical protein K6G94_01630 [Kiritimatiellae bacterium]|nr:hypothetical protein [Kiritimatiellia bacterium]
MKNLLVVCVAAAVFAAGCAKWWKGALGLRQSIYLKCRTKQCNGGLDGERPRVDVGIVTKIDILDIGDIKAFYNKCHQTLKSGFM